MEHEDEQDWYHDVLTGAMKYLHEDAIPEDREDKLYAFTLETLTHFDLRLPLNEGLAVMNKPDMAAFVKVMGSGEPRRLRIAFARSMHDELAKRHFRLVRAERKGLKSIELEPISLEPVRQDESITEDDVEEIISGQLSAVIEESRSELKSMRIEFNCTREALSNEFEKKLLEISCARNGEST